MGPDIVGAGPGCSGWGYNPALVPEADPTLLLVLPPPALPILILECPQNALPPFQTFVPTYLCWGQIQHKEASAHPFTGLSNSCWGVNVFYGMFVTQ